MSRICPDLEALFDEIHEGHRAALEHSEGCEHCAAILEEHRQLEKDLFRLADPLPPPDFVHKVMIKVRMARAPHRHEMHVFAFIITLALAMGAATFVLGDGNLGTLGVRLAEAVVRLRELAIAAASGLTVLWKSAAGPLTVGLFVTLCISLFGLRRLAGGTLTEAKVSS